MNGRSKRRISAVVSALFLCILAGTVSSCGALCLRDYRSGQLLAAFPARTGEAFDLRYTHSVNRGEVRDHFSVAAGGDLLLRSSTFESFGAGMSDGLEAGIALTLGPEGLELGPLDRTLSTIDFAVGSVANHRLAYRGATYEISKYARPLTFVRIAFEYIAPWRLNIQARTDHD